MQAQEVQESRHPEAPSAFLKRTRGGAWKDHWVAMLVELRGCLNEDFMKPQKQGADLWTRVAAEISAACDGFDKDSESCRKKWQKVYKLYKEDKLRLVKATADNSQSSSTVVRTCKWFHLIEKYMQNYNLHFKSHNHTSGTSELALIDDTNLVENACAAQEQGAACIDSSHTTVTTQTSNQCGMNGPQMNNVESLSLACTGNVGAPSKALSVDQHDTSNHIDDEEDLQGDTKRARREHSVEQCLSQMAETWRDALEAMKEADARRLEVLQSLAVTMAGLLDVLKKW